MVYGVFRTGNCKINKAAVIINIPTTEGMSGLTSGNNNQLNTHPVTGTTNFHIFSSDTFTVGFLSKVYHMLNPAAGIIANHIRAAQNSNG